MSFGFSVFDFISLGGLAFKLYAEFKAGHGACQNFASELLLLHQVLNKLGSDLDGNVGSLGPFDHAALKACANSCKDLIYVEIYGAACVPASITPTDLDILDNEARLRHGGSYPIGNGRFIRAWREKWGERTFAARIPKLQQAVTAHVQSLTAFSTLLVRWVRFASSPYASQDLTML